MSNEDAAKFGVKDKDIVKVRTEGPRGLIFEKSLADCFPLGVKAPIRESGDIEGTPGLKLVGPAGEVELEKGVIVASRHIHMSNEDAAKFGVKDKDIVKVRTEGPRGLIFENVLVRAKDNFNLEMHVDMEEGNAAGVKNGDLVELIAE